MGKRAPRTYTYRQRPKTWVMDRVGKITSSVIPFIVKERQPHLECVIQKILIEQLTGKPFRDRRLKNVEMSNVECIPSAIEQYQKRTGNKAEAAVRFYQHPSCNMAGASPDGFITARDTPHKGLLHIHICRLYREMWDMDKRSEESNDPKRILPETEYAKVQFIMNCTSTKWCDYVLRNELHDPVNFGASIHDIQTILRVPLDQPYLNDLWQRIAQHVRYLRTMSKRKIT